MGFIHGIKAVVLATVVSVSTARNITYWLKDSDYELIDSNQYMGVNTPQSQ